MVTFIDLRYILDKINEDMFEEEQYKSVYEINSISIDENFINIYQDIVEYVYTISDLYFSTRIPNIAVPRLANLYKLEVLRLLVSDLPIIIPPEFSKLEHLHTLNIDSQELTHIPENLSIIPNLSNLGLSHNKLNPIPLSLFQLYKLETLHIDSNGLTNIPDEITQLTRLTCLNISSNNITTYPECINRIHTLRKLVYAENELAEIPIDVPNLKKLKLCNNNIVKFPDFIYSLKYLEHLEISSLGSIKSDLYNIISLKHLIIPVHQNDQSIASNIGKLTNLEFLDIWGHGYSIPDEIMNLGLLKDIHISQTQFNLMSEKMKLALRDKIYNDKIYGYKDMESR